MKGSINFRQIREFIRIEDILDCYGVQHNIKKRNEKQMVGFCPLPFHPKQPRNSFCFSVEIERNLWKCSLCRDSGNLFDFVKAMEGFNDVCDAAQWIIERFPQKIFVIK